MARPREARPHRHPEAGDTCAEKFAAALLEGALRGVPALRRVPAVFVHHQTSPN
jgi:hypothetical protein